MGVDVFFCLSGFLMSGLLFVQRQSLAKFYKRRISRILPAFAAFVIAIYCVSALQGKDFSSAEVMSTLFFARTYWPLQPGIWEGAVPIGHLWSLNVEEHGYMFMSILVLLPWVRSREGLFLLLSGITCIAIGFLYVKLDKLAPHWGNLGTEVAAAHLFISAGYRLLRERLRPYVPSWLPLVTMASAIFCYSNNAPWWSSGLLTPFLLAFTVNHLSETGEAVKSILASRPLRQMGIWSFSIYIWQQPFYAAKNSFWGGSTTALVSAMTMSLLSFYLLEKPSRTWLNRNW
jgi:peptidoglycan/LPS O-acetylase OafA/YrhL